MDNQEIQALIDRDNLGRIAAARYEAESFLQMHGKDYFPTPQNGKLISDYVQQNNLPLSAEGFEEAFTALQKSGDLLPARESVARMSADEIKEFAKQNGTPVYGPDGRVLGHNLPSAYSEPTSGEGYNRPRARYTQSTLSSHPEDAKRNPSKREFAMWDHQRAKDWLIERGYWDGDLPEFLR